MRSGYFSDASFFLVHLFKAKASRNQRFTPPNQRFAETKQRNIFTILSSEFAWTYTGNSFE